MTDLEITRLCAKAMGIVVPEKQFKSMLKRHLVLQDYDPLHNDEQSMALVKKFRLNVEAIEIGAWAVCNYEATIKNGAEPRAAGTGRDLNRAICECVARMQAAKDGAAC